MNKKYLDPISPRYTAIDRAGKVEFRLPELKEYAGVSVPLLPKDKERAKGSKVIMQGPVLYLEPQDAAEIDNGEEVTLIGWGNAIATKVVRDAAGHVLYIDGKLNPEGSVKTTEKKLTWVAATDADLVPCTLVEFDYLITEPVLQKGQDHKSFLTKQTKIQTPALGEPAMRVLQKDAIIELQRRGFFRVDQPYLSPTKPMVLFFVPSGKSKSMAGLEKVQARTGKVKATTSSSSSSSSSTSSSNSITK